MTTSSTHVRLVGKKIDSMRDLEIKNPESVQELEIGINHIQKIEALDQFENLTLLDLWRNQISTIEGLDRLENLQYLDLGM